MINIIKLKQTVYSVPATYETDNNWRLCDRCGKKVYVSITQPQDVIRHENECTEKR